MLPNYPVLDSDVLVIGAGGAGCSAAMAAADAGAHVTLLDKGRLGLTGSTFDPFTWGKGIAVAARGFNPSDDPEVHYRLAIEAARGLADPVLAQIVAYEAPARFRELLDAGFPFRVNRLGACFGEGMIGAVINQPDLAKSFRREIARRPIRLLEGVMATGLLGERGRCSGAVAVTRSGELIAFRAKTVILATGGASTIFRYNFNAPALTGDGQIMALHAGAALTNVEFYQAILGTTHPARVFFPQWFLAGVPSMRNAAGRAFLPDYLPPGADPEQLVLDRSSHGPFTSSRPTGRVDIAIYGEILAGRGTAPPGDERRLAGIWCDFAALPEAQRRDLDDGVGRPALAWLRARRLDLEAGPVPIAPFAHAGNGGIVIDEHGETAVPGLYACGEVAAGPHGANRVGGHMAAVLLVFGARAGQHAARAAVTSPLPALDRVGLQKVSDRIAKLYGVTNQMRPHAVRRAIQMAMSPVMIAKDAAGLEQALARLEGIREEELPDIGVQSIYDVGEALSVMNLLEMATLVARSALLRGESRGPHYRTDFPAEGGTAFERNLMWHWEEKAHLPSWASRRGGAPAESPLARHIRAPIGEPPGASSRKDIGERSESQEMPTYIAKRLLQLLPTLILVSIITFTLVRFVPGDPIDVMYGLEGADKETRAAMEKTLGLDQPVVIQYFHWAGRILTGDLGFSYRARVPVTTLIGQRLPNTIILVIAALGIVVFFAIPLGVLAALRRNSVVDFGAMASALIALSVPPFASGIALVLIFGLLLGWLPTMGAPPPGSGLPGLLRHLTLPAITLAMAVLGVTMRLTRSTVLEELGRDYVRTARAKGLAERWVVFRHLLRNALLPVVTLIGLQAAYLVGGAVIIEVVFAWPGIGSLVVDAILSRDYPIVQSVILLVAAMVMAVSIVVDLTYPILDPRVRLE